MILPPLLHFSPIIKRRNRSERGPRGSGGANPDSRPRRIERHTIVRQPTRPSEAPLPQQGRVARSQDPIRVDPILQINRPRTQRPTVLNQSDPQSGSGSVLGGVGLMEDVGEQEADELEGDGNDERPEEGEQRPDGERVDQDRIP